MNTVNETAGRNAIDIVNSGSKIEGRSDFQYQVVSEFVYLLFFRDIARANLPPLTVPPRIHTYENYLQMAAELSLNSAAGPFARWSAVWAF